MSEETKETFAFEVKKKTKIKINIYGQTYELHKPTVSEAKALSVKEVSTNNGDSLDGAKDLLAGLGLPRDVSDDMELDHFMQLLDFILEFTKKK